MIYTMRVLHMLGSMTIEYCPFTVSILY